MKPDQRSIREHIAARDLTNKKPIRTKAQKAQAKASARMVDGRWVSDAPKGLSRPQQR